MEFKWFVEVMYVTPIRPVQSYAVIPLVLQNWLNFYNHSLQPGFFPMFCLVYCVKSDLWLTKKNSMQVIPNASLLSLFKNLKNYSDSSIKTMILHKNWLLLGWSFLQTWQGPTMCKEYLFEASESKTTMLWHVQST